SRRARSRRAWRRTSSCTTFAGRGAGDGRATTKYRCRCISCSSLLCRGRPRRPQFSERPRAKVGDQLQPGVDARRLAVLTERMCQWIPVLSALCPLSYGRLKEPPAGVEPAPRPYEGRVLAVDTTEAKWRRSESNRHRPRCKRVARPVELR